MIYTVGYQRMTLEGLRKLVRSLGVDRIIDVRSAPRSKRPDFNRARLAEAFGKRYLWKGDVLGGRRPISEEAIRWLAGQKGTLLLMCMEDSPCDCHRFLEIGRRLLGQGVSAFHIFDGRALTTIETQEVCDGKGDKDPQYRLGFPEP